ncbi:MAG TPA: hypothetical protein VFF68_05775 [Anaerolineaceae bacterium]|nr:hypothetical protein [Anaerolineaceae bacterium]
MSDVQSAEEPAAVEIKQTSSEVLSGGLRRHCENCRTETEEGNIYRYYYGTEISKSSTMEGSYQKITTTYDVAGTQETYLCNQCLAVKFLKSSRISFIGLFILAFVLLSIFFIAINKVSILTVLALLAGLLSLFFTFKVLREWRAASAQLKNKDVAALRQLASMNPDLGDLLSIEITSYRLKSRGFTNFWSRSQYQGLSKTKN